MNYRTFGRLGWRVSEIGFGTAWLGNSPGKTDTVEQCAEVLQRALDAGINYIDTARYYGPSEEILGKALQGMKRGYYLATKAGLEPRDFDYSRGAVLRSFETSLKLLRGDRVDLLQLHEANTTSWESLMGPGGALEALQQLKSEGVVTGFGVTGRKPEFLAKLIDTGEFDSVLTYGDYDLTTTVACEALLPVAKRRNVAIVLGSPLRSGALAPGSGDGTGGKPTEEAKKVRRLREAFSDLSGPLHHTALRYLWGDPDISTVLSGLVSVEDLNDVLAAAEKGKLSKEELALIRHIQEPRGLSEKQPL